MAVFDPTPPNFNLQYNVGTVPNIGEGYAKGITAAGESIAGALSAKAGSGGVFDIMNRNRTADDTLTAMSKNGILSSDAYQSVANKSLGAKEQMLGMYAGQWIAQQAANREMQKAGYQGNVEVDVAHQKLLDTINAVKTGYGAAVGVQPGKLQVAPQQAAVGATTVTPMSPLQPGKGVPALSTGLSGTAANPSPLGSTDITNPQLVTSPGLAAAQAQKAQTKLNVGPPLSGKDPVPPGGRVGSVSGQRGVLMPDGVTFRPFQ
jgi:hypothetical protein